jgi:O-acetyl-ADP-ribose deacetylase (regulator of RNase III)
VSKPSNATNASMEVQVGQSTLELVDGDITQQDTEAIVNAANNSLLGGAGVDGAIHRAAGPTLLTECRALGGCETGEAKVTSGCGLKAKYVIHAVGPVYSQSGRKAPELLANAYRNSLRLATRQGIKSVAFPSISTGAYGYPVAEAARIALDTVADYLLDHPSIQLVRFVLFGQPTYQAYVKALNELMGE